MYVMETTRHLLWTKKETIQEKPGKKSWHDTCIKMNVKKKEGDVK